MYDAKYCQYYDLIHSKKDYDGEVKVVLDIASKYYQHPIKEVLDVGCGTGEHSFALAQTGLLVDGVDTSPLMTDVAHSKISNTYSFLDVAFLSGNVDDMPTAGYSYDMAISLFNVVNHVLTIEKLIELFCS